MPFSDFTNPYQNPANIPQKYRQHINLLKLFKADGSYVRPAEDPVRMWALEILVEEYGVPLEADELNRRRNEAKHLYTEAENLLTEAKTRVERIILGEEDVT
ncbi:MAG: hypothetical protein RMZ43_015325 [Nostoc sp. CmiVER01]|uniref:hypothetical protein n=1 Tax=Nostoc sp. CmiVER01 TaxID=3075384 RepID=UPI002AD3F7BA|nr:hypothetical protein [Nostoc sp. CmiVER01]MDZ8122722.1 hypothetical protein [Nostoc sp. CmiVER01]